MKNMKHASQIPFQSLFFHFINIKDFSELRLCTNANSSYCLFHILYWLSLCDWFLNSSFNNITFPVFKRKVDLSKRKHKTGNNKKIILWEIGFLECIVLQGRNLTGYWQQFRKLIWVCLFSSVCFIHEILVFCNTGKYGQRKTVFWHILQKQPPEVFCKKRRSWKFRKIHRKTPVPGTLFWQSCRPRPARISKNNFFTEHLWATASDFTQCFLLHINNSQIILTMSIFYNLA